MNAMGALFISSTFLGIVQSILIQPIISMDRAVMYRERAAGMYNVMAWYFGMVRAYTLASALGRPFVAAAVCSSWQGLTGLMYRAFHRNPSVSQIHLGSWVHWGIGSAQLDIQRQLSVIMPLKRSQRAIHGSQRSNEVCAMLFKSFSQPAAMTH